MSTYDQYLATLRRVPDDVILSMATREYEAAAVNRCLCGWAIREQVARMANVDAEEVNVSLVRDKTVGFSTPSRCAFAFGGSSDEWEAIFSGVVWPETAPVIERAFVERVLEAV